MWVLFALCASIAQAGPGRIGNPGDDGADLEGADPIKSGPIIEAREKALELVKGLGTESITGLGTLVPELEKSDLYLANRDVNAGLPEDQGGFHSDMRGLVFARTFTEPHAPTRFFPIAEKLSQDQLVALHIHEALHRALPASVRENEAAVAAITVAFASPNPSKDRVSAAVNRWFVPSTTQASSVQDIPERALARTPSLLAYTLRNFSAPKGPALYSVSRMHLIQSYLYPFGGEEASVGVGIEASLVSSGSGSDAGSRMGPLGVSTRMRLWSGRGFDIDAWGNISLNTLSADELKNSPVGRDVGSLGLAMRKDLRFFYVENILGYSFPGSADYPIGPYTYQYAYGGVVSASARAGTVIGPVEWGGFAEFALADYFRVSGPGLPSQDTGRYRVLTAGPEFSFRSGEFQAKLSGRWMVNASKDVNYDTLGNLLGQGMGQGGVSASLGVLF